MEWDLLVSARLTGLGKVGHLPVPNPVRGSWLVAEPVVLVLDRWVGAVGLSRTPCVELVLDELGKGFDDGNIIFLVYSIRVT